jgi:hypothetical protein
MTTPPIINVFEANTRVLAPHLAKEPVLDKAVANDVVPALRTLTEADVRLIIRQHAMPLILQFYHAVQRGEVQRAPGAHLFRAIAENPSIQWSIVQRGSDLSDAQIDSLRPPALRQACGEVIILARCVYPDEQLASVILEEVSVLAPELMVEAR